jgi:hypothetical protein
MRTKIGVYISKIADMVYDELIQVSILQKWFCTLCDELHDPIRADMSLHETCVLMSHRSQYELLINSNKPHDCSFWNFIRPYLFSPVCNILRKREISTGTEATWVEMLIYEQILKIWNELFTMIRKYKIQFDKPSDVLHWMEFYDKPPHFIAKHMCFGRNKKESSHMAKHFYKIPKIIGYETLNENEKDRQQLWVKARFDTEDNVIIELRGAGTIAPYKYMLNTVTVPICKFKITVNQADIQQEKMPFQNYLQEQYAEMEYNKWAVEA